MPDNLENAFFRKRKIKESFQVVEKTNFSVMGVRVLHCAERKLRLNFNVKIYNIFCMR